MHLRPINGWVLFSRVRGTTQYPYSQCIEIGFVCCVPSELEFIRQAST